jgi:transcriptional regulator with XRE-family HTH domain
LSQTELANSLGVTFQQVQKYEKGVNRVPGVRLAQIAKLFDVPITQLLPGGTGSQEPHIAGEWLFQLIQERPIVELLRVLNDVPQPSRKDVVHAVREIVYALHSVRG